MSLAAQEWRYIGSQAYGAATCAAAMDAAYALGTAITYADTSARTPGSGSAWTWGRDQNVGITECIHGIPPTSTLGMRINVAGTSTIPGGSFTLRAPDITPAANQLHVNLSKNVTGTYSAGGWNAASIFGDGQDWDYWRIWPTSAGTGTAHMWEGREGVAMLFGGVSSWYGFVGGALFDPESTNPLDQESDGRRYGLLTSGTAAISSTFTTSSGVFSEHGAVNNNAHAGVFDIGAVATVVTLAKSFQGATATTTCMKSKGGVYMRTPILYRAASAAPNDFFVGRLREITFFCDSKTPLKQAGIGYIFGSSAAVDQDCFFLEHA